MALVLTSAGLAAQAIGRSLYQLMDAGEPDGGDGALGPEPALGRPASDACILPDLDVPEGWDVSGDELLLTCAAGVFEQLAAWLPRRHSVARWTLLFSTAADGYALSTLYRKACERGPLLLLVADTRGSLFGAYVAHTLAPPSAGHSLGEASQGTVNPGDNISFYGHGETFLFEVLPMHNLPPLLDGSAPPRVSVCAYRWAHADDLFVASLHDFLAVGGGGGHYGLRLDSDLQHGRSGRGATFRNPPLGTLPLRPAGAAEAAHAPGGAAPEARCGTESRFFEVAAVEVWSVDDWTLRHHAPHAAA